MRTQYRFIVAPLAAPRGEIAELSARVSRRSIFPLEHASGDGLPAQFSRGLSGVARAIGGLRPARSLSPQIQSA
jgi:hypothetical protein